MDNYQKLNEEIKKIPAAVNCSENPLLLSISGDNSDIRQIEETNHIINDDNNSEKYEYQLSTKKKENIMDRIQKPKRNTFEDTDMRTSFDYILLLVLLVTIGALIAYGIFYYITPKISILYTNEKIAKPLIDDNKYEIIQLLNGIEVVLVSNSNLTTGSAALVVNSGYMTYPESEGVPHITEHMLFLGNEKNPSKSYILDLVSKYYGNINGKTEEYMTSFFFDIGKEGFKEGLDAFASMFKNPIINKTALVEEINNVHEEYSNQMYESNICEEHLLNNLVYTSSYSTSGEILAEGNKETLNKKAPDVLQSEVKEYIKKTFVGKSIKIAIMSNENIGTMRGLAIKHFASIAPGENIKEKESSYNLGRVITQIIKGSISYIDIMFYIKAEESTAYYISYLKYIQYILRSTEPKSLFSELYSKNKIMKISTQTKNIDNKTMKLSIRVHLLSSAVDDINVIIRKVYNYMRIIRETEINEKKYTELENIFEKQMMFHEQKEANSAFTVDLAQNLFKVGKEGIKFINYEMFLPKKDPETIKKLFSQMTPENSVIVLSFSSTFPYQNITNFPFVKSPSDFFKMDKTTHYYNIQFNFEDINIQILSELANINQYDSVLAIPTQENLFLTKLNSLVSTSSNEEENTSILPTEIYGNYTNHLSIFHKLDRTFRLPKFHLAINLIHPFFRKNISFDYSIYLLYVTYLQNEINTIFCDAIAAGSSIQMETDENGIFIHITSYTDLFDIINEYIYKAILNQAITFETFDFYKELVVEELTNLYYTQPFRKTSEYFKMIMKYSMPNKYEIDFIKKEEANEAIKRYNTSMVQQIVTLLYYGNIEKEKVDSVYSKYLEGKINETSITIELNYDKANKKDFLPFLHKMHLLPQYTIVYQLSKYLPQVATSNYFLVGLNTQENDILSDLVTLIWEEKFFNELRNVKNIGFYVYSKKVTLSNQIFFNFVIQCSADNNKYDEKNMNYELDNVLNGTVRKAIDELDEDKLYNLRMNLVYQKNQKEISLSARAKNMMNRVFYKVTDDPEPKENPITKDNIKEYTVSRVQDFFYNVFYKDVHKLSVQVYYDKGGQYYREKESYILNNTLSTTPTDNLFILS